MKEGWEYRIFESCLVKVPKQVQVKSKDYKKEGKFPIVSQEAELISGYWDDETIVYKHKEPVVIFGDHTKNIKYVDFNFVVGADGTHILSTKKDINPKFFYYVLKSIKLRELGYARHYKLLKEKYIPVPPLSEQQSIVDYLDSAFAKIDAMKANAEKALNEAKVFFQASLKEMLEPKEGWEETTFGDLVVSNVVGMTRGKVEQGYDKKYPYFKMNNISPDNALCWDDLICVDANKEELDKYSLQEGDFLFNTRNSKEWVGKSAVYRNYCTPVMLYNNNVMRIRFVDVVNPVFIAYSFLADFTKEQLEKIKSGTTNVWAIYYRDLSKILLTYPSPAEQQSIVATLDSLKSKVARLQENYDKISQECDALKQAILRQVFE